jgi:hypothetical protein
VSRSFEVFLIRISHKGADRGAVSCVRTRSERDGQRSLRRTTRRLTCRICLIFAPRLTAFVEGVVLVWSDSNLIPLTDRRVKKSWCGILRESWQR